MLIPMARMVMFGRMIRNMRHAVVIYAVSLLMLGELDRLGRYHDTGRPNPGLTDRPALTDANGRPLTIEATDKDGKAVTKEVPAPALAGLPVDQDTGQPGGQGTAVRHRRPGRPGRRCTTVTSNGSVNCMHDSLNPLAGLTPLTGMWLNCVFGGVGVGLINMLIYLIVAVFLAGLMVGRTPEYLGKKVEAREMKLAMLALLIHPLMILAPTGLFAALDWGTSVDEQPGAHGFSEILYEFTSSSANNGSGFEGLGDTYGFNDPKANPSPPAPCAPHWDIALRPGDADLPVHSDHRPDRLGRRAWRARSRRRSRPARCGRTR